MGKNKWKQRCYEHPPWWSMANILGIQHFLRKHILWQMPTIYQLTLWDPWTKMCENSRVCSVGKKKARKHRQTWKTTRIVLLEKKCRCKFQKNMWHADHCGHIKLNNMILFRAWSCLILAQWSWPGGLHQEITWHSCERLEKNAMDINQLKI